MMFVLPGDWSLGSLAGAFVDRLADNVRVHVSWRGLADPEIRV